MKVSHWGYIVGRILAACLLLMNFATIALAQEAADYKSDMQSALERGDHDAALHSANAFYEYGIQNGDQQSAGHAAFAKGLIYKLKNEPLEAAKSYKLCSKHYKQRKAMAEAFQCQFESAMAYRSANKHGSSIDMLKDTASGLKKIGQENSELAANVYITLAKDILPSKFNQNYNDGAKAKRLSSVKYADKAIVALAAIGQTNTQKYAASYFLKGRAFEEALMYEEAALAYEQALSVYESLPNKSPQDINNVSARYSIAKSYTKDAQPKNIINVEDVNGKDVILKIKKKKKIKFPKLHKNQLVDGAHVKAEISLTKDGGVASITILESAPAEEFGEAFEKAVKTWKFTPPEDIAPEDIPPFEYRMTFFVKRI